MVVFASWFVMLLLHAHLFKINRFITICIACYHLSRQYLTNSKQFGITYRVNKHPTGCHTGCRTGLTTGWMFVCTIQPVVKPLYNQFDNRLNVCIYDTTGCQTGLTPGLTTGCIMYTNIQRVVKEV